MDKGLDILLWCGYIGKGRKLLAGVIVGTYETWIRRKTVVFDVNSKRRHIDSKIKPATSYDEKQNAKKRSNRKMNTMNETKTETTEKWNGWNRHRLAWPKTMFCNRKAIQCHNKEFHHNMTI